MAITPDGKTVYVADLNANTVTPISTATNTAGPPIKVGKNPGVIAITPDGKTAYVIENPSINKPDFVTPIATATNKPGKAIKVGANAVAIAFAP
jgi:YVTN family beta-propeller protein